MSGSKPAAAVPFALAAALFFLSGTGALVVESTWLRGFRVLLGAAAPAASATLVAFFSGQVIGALAGARIARAARFPLRAYGLLEALAALAALAAAPLLHAFIGAVDGFYADGRAPLGALTVARFGAAWLSSLPASIAFGATFPVLAAAVSDRASALGPRGGGLYAVNTAGGALGAALAAFVLTDWWGVSGAMGAGVACLGVAAAGAIAFGRVAPAAGRRGAGAGEVGPAPVPARLAGLAAASGAGIFASQVLLTQALSRVLDQSAHAFGAVLVTTLVALALGAGTAVRVRFATPATLLGWAAVTAALGFGVLPGVLVFATGGLAYLGSDAPYPGYLLAAFRLAATTAGPVWFAAAFVWPALLAVASRDARGDGRTAGALAGRLLAWNTAGAIVGAIAAPWWLLPAFGLWGSLLAVAALYGAIALALPSPGRPIRAGVLGAAGLCLVLVAPPGALPAFRVEPGDRVLEARSTAAGLVAVIARDGGRLIQIDNHYALGGTADTVHQERQGHLPLLLHPGAKSALFLGSATGSSAAAALAHGVERLVMVEIVPGVADAAARWFDDVNHGVHHDPRTRVVVDDARSYVRAGTERFDVIVGDLFVPWRAGTGSLFTREHFEAVRARLSAGGLFCQWLPLYQLTEDELQTVLTTFDGVFPGGVAFRGDFFGSHPILALIGGRGLRIDADATSRAAARLAAAGVTDRWVTHPFGPWALYAGPLGAVAAHWATAPRNTDDTPILETLAARHHAGGGAGQAPPFVGLALSQLGKALREGADARGLEPVRGFGPAQRRAAEGGHALQTASALWNRGRTGEASQALARAARLLPADLLAHAPADPTASEVWPADAR